MKRLRQSSDQSSKNKVNQSLKKQIINRSYPEPNSYQPLVLATASDWIVSGSAMRSAIYDMKKEEKSLSSVR